MQEVTVQSVTDVTDTPMSTIGEVVVYLGSSNRPPQIQAIQMVCPTGACSIRSFYPNCHIRLSCTRSPIW